MKKISKPGVILAFDDYDFIEDWLNAADIFKQFGAHVTFFINAPDMMNQEQWNGLKKLVSMGHAIGCHSLNHFKAIEYSQKNGHDQWVKDEINSSLEILKKHGFYITSFAYPYSQNNDMTDNAIKTYFKHARTGAFLSKNERLANLNAVFKPVHKIGESFILPSKGIDHFEDYSMIDEAACRASNQNELLFLHGHRIGLEEKGKNNRNLTHKDNLIKILEIIIKNNLNFYTFNDLH